MKILEVAYKKPSWFLIEGKEGKNVHLTHLEDLVFDEGYAGAEKASKKLQLNGTVLQQCSLAQIQKTASFSWVLKVSLQKMLNW